MKDLESFIDESTVFLTCRRDMSGGGGLIRIKGVLKYLRRRSPQNELHVFCSNTGFKDQKGIAEHVVLPNISKTRKRIAQLLTVAGYNRLALKTLLNKNVINKLKYRLRGKKIFAFEHLDTTLGYLLKETRVVKGYAIDVHGYPKIEFSSLKYIFHKLIVTRHDRLVMRAADFICFPSERLYSLYADDYEELNAKPVAFLPYLILSNEKAEVTVSRYHADYRNYEKAKNFGRNRSIIMFVGALKINSGIEFFVETLIHNQIINGKEVGFILIGEGRLEKKVLKSLLDNEFSHIHIKKINYRNLRAFQMLADCLICPHENNSFSNSVLHLKLLDSMSSGVEVVACESDAIHDSHLANYLHLYKDLDKRSLVSALKDAMNPGSFEIAKQGQDIINSRFTYEKFVMLDKSNAE